MVWSFVLLHTTPLHVSGDNSIDKADIKRLKESGVFGPLTFWVTEIKNLEELGNPNAGVSSSCRGCWCDAVTCAAQQRDQHCGSTRTCYKWRQAAVIHGHGCGLAPIWASSASTFFEPLAALCVFVLQASGVLIRGNLRTDRLKVFTAVCDKVQELFGDKYTVLMIEDPEAYMDGPAPGPASSSSSNGSSSKGEAAGAQEPRVAFQVCCEGLREA